MYTRKFNPPDRQSFFIFGPRGTGKTTWLKLHYPKALYLDLLNNAVFTPLTAHPERLEEYIPKHFDQVVIIDEVQKIPALLDEIHRLIESHGYRFILTGSSARKLRKTGTNLLAGRALTRYFFPLTAEELGADFELKRSLEWGHLPMVFSGSSAKDYLQSYIGTYLKEEVMQEGLTRNLGAFARFLETASLSQAAPLNISSIARESSIDRKVCEEYFYILEDLLIAHRLPVFQKKAKRRMHSAPKFYYFDVGVFRSIRPKGPLEDLHSLDGIAAETLVFQELIACNAYLNLGFTFSYWRTSTQKEVDFVAYGERGLIAIEVKISARIRPEDLDGLRLFLEDYPMAKAWVFYGGLKSHHSQGIDFLPIEDGLKQLPAILSGKIGSP